MRKRIIAERAFLLISVARLFLVKNKRSFFSEFLFSDGYKNGGFQMLHSVSHCRQESGNTSAQDYCSIQIPKLLPMRAGVLSETLLIFFFQNCICLPLYRLRKGRLACISLPKFPRLLLR